MNYTQDDIKLLYKYLKKFYGDSRAKELIQENSDNLFGKNSLSYSLGKRSIEYFSLHYLDLVFSPSVNPEVAPLASVHYKLWDDLSKMFIEDEFDNYLAILPRSTGKSTVCDFAISVWSHCYKQSIYTLVAGRTEKDALEFIKQTRSAFEDNEKIINTFGKLIEPKKFVTNSLNLELSNFTKIEAISSTSSMRGRKFSVKGVGYRPTLVIADDYQGKSDIVTQEARDKKYNMFMEDVKYVGSRALYKDGKKIKRSTKFIVLGTILHRDCLCSRLIKNPNYNKVIEKGILVDDIDELFNSGLWSEFKKILFNHKDNNSRENAKEFYYQHEDEMKYPVLWQSYWSCLDLALDYYESPSSFKQEMQNDASKIGEKAFHNIKKLSKETIEEKEFSKTMLLIDPAVETTKRNDYTAFIVGSKSFNEFRYVRKGIIDKLKFEKSIEKSIELLKEYEDVSHIWIEKNTFNGRYAADLQKAISNDSILCNRDFVILNERQNKNKEAKIRSISGKVDSGFIIFNEEDTEFYNQVLDYEGEGYSLHDDAPDILAEFDRLIDEIVEIQPISLMDRRLLGL